MKIFRNFLLGAGLALGMVSASSAAKTDGDVEFTVKVSNYTGKSSSKHWNVVWVTTSSGTFIKTLRIQGNEYDGSASDLWSSHWDRHCSVWYDARDGSKALDGYTSATTSSYSTFVVPWDCRDASDNLVADGDYSFHVQYAEDDSPSPSTSVLWTKGPSASTTNYPNQGTTGSPSDGNNFTQLAVTWTPDTVAPSITSTAPTSTGTVGVSYSHTCTADGTTPITFSANGLPTGLTISSSGEISGIPEEAGLFTGTITATNGTSPNATQAFSIEIIEVSVLVSTVQALGGDFMMGGEGPPNGTYTLLSTTNPSLPLASWTEVNTGTFNGAGQFSITRPITAGVPALYYRLRIP